MSDEKIVDNFENQNTIKTSWKLSELQKDFIFQKYAELLTLDKISQLVFEKWNIEISSQAISKLCNAPNNIDKVDKYREKWFKEVWEKEDGFQLRAMIKKLLAFADRKEEERPELFVKIYLDLVHVRIEHEEKVSPQAIPPINFNVGKDPDEKPGDTND